MHGYVRQCAAVHGSVRLCVAMHGYEGLRTAMYGSVRLKTVNCFVGKDSKLKTSHFNFNLDEITATVTLCEGL